MAEAAVSLDDLREKALRGERITPEELETARQKLNKKDDEQPQQVESFGFEEREKLYGSEEKGPKKDEPPKEVEPELEIPTVEEFLSAFNNKKDFVRSLKIVRRDRATASVMVLALLELLKEIQELKELLRPVELQPMEVREKPEKAKKPERKLKKKDK
jgi:hypothetical protein